MDTNSETIVYKVNGFDSIEVMVNPKTMKIQAGKSKLEEHIGQKDLDVKELISDGVLYNLESKLSSNHEITATIECDVEIKEEPIESKDLQETEDPLQIPSTSQHEFKIEACESSENNIDKGTELKKLDDFPAIQSEFSVYATAQRHHLDKHIQAVHEGKKPFQCEFCLYATAEKHTLTIHIQAVHEGKKPFQCEFCDYAAAQN